ncbi:CDH23 [Mytilus coruscus]|uniref:CDH23 n=1 Tax=Mytilus coruscus TaxID=42192 RepID=A0A6J8CBF7_MYTCO|nr:CDH23 [Mytilus coruscus]
MKYNSAVLHNLFVAVFIFLSSVLQFVVTNDAPKQLEFSATNTIIIPENTALNSTIGTIKARDLDGPMPIIFSIQDEKTRQLVRLGTTTGDSTRTRQVDIILIAPLDRDRDPSDRKLYFIMADGDNTIEHNQLIITISLYITDVNDEHPEFHTRRYKESVLENAAIGTTVGRVSAIDEDNGLGGKVTYSMQPAAQTADDTYKNAFRIDPNTGDVIINNVLDYERHNFYEFVISAQDGMGLKSTADADFVVTVTDIQDTPPAFFNLPYSVSVKENISLGEKVLQVTALDGDRGVPNNITYKFTQGDFANFSLNENSGWITIKSALDRDDDAVTQKGGVYAMYVQASEVVKQGSANNGPTTTSTLVTITVEDVNDNKPEFNANTYTAKILENMQDGVPVTLTGVTTTMSVSDKDQGQNSIFSLSFEKNGQPYYDFSPQPSTVYSLSPILIRVNNSKNLDYEKMNSTTFQVIAREIHTVEKKSSVATVTVNIEDVNDIPPQFQSEIFSASIPENSAINTPVITVNATDEDSGIFGQLTYSLRGGNGKFVINDKTGEVSVAGDLDREKVDEYYLTVEAKDGGGFRSTTELRIIREEYFSTIKEKASNFQRGKLIVEAFDIDEPNTPNSLIKYEINKTPTGLENNFEIDILSGEITVKSPLDYEALDPKLNGKVVLIVEAMDWGNPRRSKVINVTIEVEDVNDNAPVFNQPSYTAHVLENATDTTVVTQIKATDADGTFPNNEFVYRIDSGSQDQFRINFKTGEISVETGAKLDRETKSLYILNVSATDRGSTTLVGYCQVKIYVDDVNDESPIFTSTRTVHVSENAPKTSEVVTDFTATDPDSDTDLHYSLIENRTTAFDENGFEVDVGKYNIQDYFMVEENSGIIKVNKDNIDRETAEKIALQILVEDKNGVMHNPQTATGTLTIILDDKNDNPPTFTPSSEYHVNISEGRDILDVVTTISAIDVDKNQQIKFSVAPSDSTTFQIDSYTGTVRLAKKLDREQNSEVNFKVIATDNGVPALSSTATVTVAVLDVNDESPVFNTYQSTYSISESAANGTMIAVIDATDKDIGEFGSLRYSIQINNDDGCLVINEFTGEITVDCNLDYETRKEYSIYVVARDNVNDPTNQKSTQTGQIMIRVLDVNDNAPDLKSITSDQIRIYENAPDGSTVTNIFATDPDNGENGTVDYSLTSDTNATVQFTVDTIFNSDRNQNEGVIKLKGSLLGQVGIIYVTVKATDRGSPKKSSEKKMYFEIFDVNLHQPVFIVPQGPQATISIEEQQDLNTLIIKVIANDEDHGRNGEVKYSLIPEDDYLKFTLNNDTGELRNKVVLDREVRAQYRVKIEAYDNGLPNKLKTPLALTISLIDINDKDPEFPRDNQYQPYYVGSVPEESAGALIGSVDVAVDKDSDANNSQIFYYIIGGEMQDHFHLNETGQLYLMKSIDRDGDKNPFKRQINFINLVIWATPYNYLKISPGPIGGPATSEAVVPSIYKPLNVTQLWVRVTIQDINDHPPRFREDTLSIGITRKTQFGELIFNLKSEIIDLDIGENKNHTFVQSRPLVVYPDSLSQSIGSTPFKFFSNGTLKTNTYFQADMNGYFLMSVQAKDKDMQLANATLRISLINDDQRLKVIFRMFPEQVRNFSTEFKNRLEKITGYRIVVDKIQTHENKQGKPEVDKTDMFIHGEVINPFRIVDSSELLSGYRYTWVDTPYMIKMLPVCILQPTTTQAEEDDSKRQLTMAIILLAIILGVPAIAMMFVIYFMYKKYQRKLKAATAMAYDSRDSDMQKLQLPGTNLHSYENGGGNRVYMTETSANPIFLEKILMEESGEQVDSDSIDDNAVGPPNPNRYDEQEASLQFSEENNKHNDIGSPDMNIKAALQAHNAMRNNNNETKNGKISNGNMQNGALDTRMIEGLQTTEI